MTSIKHSAKIHDLLRLPAFQVGSQVSISELSTMKTGYPAGFPLSSR